MNIVPKVPDGALSDSVILERRDEFDIRMPSSDPFVKGGTWNVLIVSLPVLKTPLIAIAYTDAATATTVKLAWQFAINQFGDSSEVSASNYRKETVYPSWFIDSQALPQVAVTICQMANLDQGKLADNMVNEFLTIRRTYMGTTMDFDANSLTNKGRLISGQIAADYSKREVDLKATDASKPTDPVIGTQTITYLSDIPYTETNLTQQDSKVRQAECVEGDYAPNRFWEPVFLNSASKDATVFAVTDPTFTDYSLTQGQENDNIPLYGWGYQISFWLSIQDTSSIRIKRREGLEMNTSAASDYSPFSTPAYPRDDRAQMMYREFCREQSHSFPAVYNSVGGMLKSIVSTVACVLENLNLPVISNFARKLAPIINSALDILPI